jgi:hypothetical protein
VGLFLTLSGIAAFFIHVILDRRIHPSACNANATRHGRPIRSRSLSPHTSGTLQLRFWMSFRVLPTTAFGPQFPVPPFLAYPSPTLSQSVPPEFTVTALLDGSGFVVETPLPSCNMPALTIVAPV